MEEVFENACEHDITWRALAFVGLAFGDDLCYISEGKRLSLVLPELWWLTGAQTNTNIRFCLFGREIGDVCLFVSPKYCLLACCSCSLRITGRRLGRSFGLPNSASRSSDNLVSRHQDNQDRYLLLARRLVQRMTWTKEQARPVTLLVVIFEQGHRRSVV
jgi:hypothetical protein